MGNFFIIVGALTWGAAALLFASSLTSPIMLIGSFVLFLAACVLLVGGAALIPLMQLNQREQDRDNSVFKMNARTHRQCPVCREIVRVDAHRCKFCTSQITPPKIEEPAAPPAPPSAPPPESEPALIPAPRQVNPKAL